MFPSILFLLLSSSVVFGVPRQRLVDRYRTGGRIVGGEDADIADYPYQLSVIDDIGPFCGAALLSPVWALSAAHCTRDYEASDLSVRAGSTISTSGGQQINVEKIIQHKLFNYETGENDISLLKLSNEVNVTNSKTIDLATVRPKANQTATVTGWGLIDEMDESDGSEVLQVIHVPIVDQEDCKKIYEKEGVTDTMFCAGYLEEGGKDSCTGDSGGPLVIDGVLAGIVSWGSGCARKGKPGVYTDVVSFLDWIDEMKSSEA